MPVRFGADLTKRFETSQFESFTFANKYTRLQQQYLYYSQLYFQMMFFLEHNFRNAVVSIHFKLWEMDQAKEKIAADGLQARTRRIAHRQTQVFNNRQSFAGLRNVSPYLSFRTCSQVNLPSFSPAETLASYSSCYARLAPELSG